MNSNNIKDTTVNNNTSNFGSSQLLIQCGGYGNLQQIITMLERITHLDQFRAYFTNWKQSWYFAKPDDIDKLLGLGIGGDDYVTKPFSPKEVAFRIKAQLRRNGYIQLSHNGDKRITFGNIAIHPSTGEVKKGDDHVTVTAKELQLLIFLASHPNQIFSKSKICEAVWGDDYVGYDNTIMVHIRRLREKIEDNPSRPHRLITIRGVGYRFILNPE